MDDSSTTTATKGSVSVSGNSSKKRDPRGSYSTLAVSPGYTGVKKRLEDEQQISAFMTEVLQQVALAHATFSQEITRAVDSSAAKFEQNLPKAFMSLLTKGQIQSTPLKEYGTLNTAWQLILEQLVTVSDEANKVADAIQSECVVNMSQNEFTKTTEWGDRLHGAMEKYKGQVDRTKLQYHQRCKERRVAQVYLANNSSILLAKKAQDNLKRAEDAEILAGEQYADSLEVVKQKQKEFFAIRMPRVLEKMQQLSEERHNRTCEALRAFQSIGKSLGPKLVGAFDGMDDSIASCNSQIDARVFVAEQSSSASLPVAYEFVPFDAEDLFKPKSPRPVRKVESEAKGDDHEQMESLDDDLEEDIDMLMDGLTLEDIEDV